MTPLMEVRIRFCLSAALTKEQLDYVSLIFLFKNQIKISCHDNKFLDTKTSLELELQVVSIIRYLNTIFKRIYKLKLFINLIIALYYYLQNMFFI